MFASGQFCQKKYEYCHEKLTHGAKEVKKSNEVYISKRDIIYIDQSEIEREETDVILLNAH